ERLSVDLEIAGVNGYCRSGLGGFGNGFRGCFGGRSGDSVAPIACEIFLNSLPEGRQVESGECDAGVGDGGGDFGIRGIALGGRGGGFGRDREIDGRAGGGGEHESDDDFFATGHVTGSLTTS